ncbi:MAG: hypothetical protein NVS3B20_11310 [Polyangiales bacterium]
MNCPSCGTKMKESHIDDYDIGPALGMSSVTVSGFTSLKCPKCGDVLVDGNVLEQTENALATAIIARGDVLSSEEIRFLRKRMDMSQAELGNRLGVHRVTVARWETDEPIPSPTSLAVRALVAFHMLEEAGIDAKTIPGLFKKAPSALSKTKRYHLELPKAS